jgi:hypothetical protein
VPPHRRRRRVEHPGNLGDREPFELEELDHEPTTWRQTSNRLTNSGEKVRSLGGDRRRVPAIGHVVTQRVGGPNRTRRREIEPRLTMMVTTTARTAEWRRNPRCV